MGTAQAAAHRAEGARLAGDQEALDSHLRVLDFPVDAGGGGRAAEVAWVAGMRQATIFLFALSALAAAAAMGVVAVDAFGGVSPLRAQELHKQFGGER